VTGGNVTGGNVTGGNVTGGNVTGGNVTGGNVTGGNVTGGNVTGGNATGGVATGGSSPVMSCYPPCAGGHASWTCVSGGCQVIACDSGYRSCDETSPDCERNVTNDAQNCGSCGNICSSAVCKAGICCAPNTRGTSGPGVDHFNFPKNYLFALRIRNDPASVLTGIGVVLFGTPANGLQVYLGVYQDTVGGPGSLISGGKAAIALSAGGEVRVPQVDLLVGNYYWIVGVANDLLTFANSSAATRTGNFRYASYAFAPLPDSAPLAMESVNSPDPNLYLAVAQCGI